MIKITENLLKTINLEAEKAYPDECCGFILGKSEKSGKKHAYEALPVQNKREEGERYHRFKIESADFMRCEREAARRALDVIGIYHSHPDHPPSPSDYDTEHALPFYSYIIVNVAKGRAGAVNSFILQDGREGWIAEALETGKDIGNIGEDL